MKIQQIAIGALIPYAKNSRTHSDEQVAQIAASITEFGWTNPVLVDEKKTIIAGHGRVLAAAQLGIKKVPCIELSGLTETQRRAYVLADNRLALNAGWDTETLKLELIDLNEDGFDLSLLGFDDDELADFLPDGGGGGDGTGSLADKFGIPPFSILNAREGWWQDRKRSWNATIGDGGESRESTLYKEQEGEFGGQLQEINSGVSILDPVLAELIVRWFGKEGGLAVDPFAGDTVFGFVAGSCGMTFEGIELRAEQSALNQARCDRGKLPCTYHTDTSENMDAYFKDGKADLVFSCPPYADLEVYSEDPKDLSVMPHGKFFKTLEAILGNTYAKLKDNRFAVVVVGEVRGKDGTYIGLVPRTIAAMQKAGYKFYNEMILVTAVGTARIRAGRHMVTSRKICKTHQNVLVFVKGSGKKAAEDMGDITQFMALTEDADGD